MIDPTVAIARREHAERQADRHHHDAGNDHQLQRRRQELRDIGHDRPVCIKGNPEIAAEQVADEIGVLGEEIVVEMQALPQDGDGVGGGIRAERDTGRIAGDHPGDGEDQQGNADQHDQRCSEPLREKADKWRHLRVFRFGRQRVSEDFTPHQLRPSDRLCLPRPAYPLPQGER